MAKKKNYTYMAMKPHLLLLLLLIASILCDPLSVAGYPFNRLSNAVSGLSKIKNSEPQLKKTKEYASKSKHLQLQLQLKKCRDLVQAYEAQKNHVPAPVLSETLQMLEKSVKLPPSVKVCVNLLKQQQEYEGEHP